MGYREDRISFLGVQWPYEKGGPLELLEFAAATGSIVRQNVVESAAEECFALGVRVLVRADGRVVDTTTGSVRQRVPTMVWAGFLPAAYRFFRRVFAPLLLRRCSMRLTQSLTVSLARWSCRQRT